MFSKYFKFKIRTRDFIKNTRNILSEFNGKRVIICGEYKGFLHLNKRYHFDKTFDIVAFVSTDDKKIKNCSYKLIDFNNIPDEKFDAILITSEDGETVFNKLRYGMLLEQTEIRLLFIETIKEARKNLSYLLKYKFDKTFPKLKRKLKNKKCIIYGAGIFLDVIDQYFSLSPLNIIGIADKKFRDTNFIKEYKGFPVYKPEQIIKINPDYVITATRQIVKVWEYLYFDNIENTKIKIIPIYKKRLLSMLHEFADS